MQKLFLILFFCLAVPYCKTTLVLESLKTTFKGYFQPLFDPSSAFLSARITFAENQKDHEYELNYWIQKNPSLQWTMNISLINSKGPLPVRHFVYTNGNLHQINLARNTSFGMKLDELTSTVNGLDLNIIDDTEETFDGFYPSENMGDSENYSFPLYYKLTSKSSNFIALVTVVPGVSCPVHEMLYTSLNGLKIRFEDIKVRRLETIADNVFEVPSTKDEDFLFDSIDKSMFMGLFGVLAKSHNV